MRGIGKQVRFGVYKTLPKWAHALGSAKRLFYVVQAFIAVKKENHGAAKLVI